MTNVLNLYRHKLNLIRRQNVLFLNCGKGDSICVRVVFENLDEYRPCLVSTKFRKLLLFFFNVSIVVLFVAVVLCIPNL